MIELDRNKPIGEQLFVGGWATAFMKHKHLYENAVTEGIVDPDKISEAEFTSRHNIRSYHNDGTAQCWDDEAIEETIPGNIGIACLAINGLFRDHNNQGQNEDLEAYHTLVESVLTYLYEHSAALRRIRARARANRPHLFDY